MNFRTVTAFTALLVLPAIAAQAQPAADPLSIWTLQDENASISAGHPTDRFYVNGLRLGWTSPTSQVPNFLADLANTLWGGGQQRVAIDLAQQIYNPADTSRFVPSPYDRPYAGVLLGNFSLMSDSDDTRSVLTLSLGIVGPGSGAENLQNSFHDLIGQDHPNGWGSQIQNTPVVELLHERTWRLPIGTVAGMETDALPSLTIALGDLRDLPADRRDLSLRPGPRIGFRRATGSAGSERRRRIHSDSPVLVVCIRGRGRTGCRLRPPAAGHPVPRWPACFDRLGRRRDAGWLRCHGVWHAANLCLRGADAGIQRSNGRSASVRFGVAFVPFLRPSLRRYRSLSQGSRKLCKWLAGKRPKLSHRKSDRRHNLPISRLGQHALRSQLALGRLVLYPIQAAWHLAPGGPW